MPNRKWPLVVAALALAALTACSEDLESNAGCPALCPGQNVDVRDTTIHSVVLDTTLRGYPMLGGEAFLLLANRPGLDVRAVFRFDTLENRFRPAGGDTTRPITEIDSTHLRLRLNLSRSIVKAAVTFLLYDVTAAVNDTAVAELAALTGPSATPIASLTVAPSALTDSVSIPVPNALVFARLAAGQRLRVGVRITSDSAVQLRVFTVESGLPASLRYDPSPDTAVRAIIVFGSSRTPASDPQVARELIDFPVIVSGTPDPSTDRLAVGGVPGRRTYFRFDIPTGLIDSTTIVRATLELTQVPVTGAYANDTTVLFPLAVAAGPTVRDPGKAALLTSPIGSFGLDSLRLVPSDSGRRSIELARLLRRWRLQPDTQLVRALVFRTRDEGTLPGELHFYSTEAAVADSLRPRLRITFIPRVEFGLP